MSDTSLPPTAPQPAAPMADARQTALIIYILMLVPFVVPVTHVVGLVMAYVSRDTAPDWLRSHYTFLIRTFWIGLLYMAGACVLCVVLVGFVLVPAVVVWYIVRCALGLSRLMRSEPYPTPESWTF
jgi:uncharacterized membrane protein